MVAMKLKIRRLRDGAKIPRRATEGAAGMDLYACIDADITLAPQQLAVVPTGIAIELPDNGCAAFLYARSGLGVKRPCSRPRSRRSASSATHSAARAASAQREEAENRTARKRQSMRLTFSFFADGKRQIIGARWGRII